MSLNGRWEGKLLDVSGPTGLVVLTLKSSGATFAGDFSISFLPPEDAECCSSGSRRLTQSGLVSGKLDSRTGRLRLNYEMTIDLNPVSVVLDGIVVKADPHARRALIGSYTVEKGSEMLSLAGGGCVLWLYANQLERRK